VPVEATVAESSTASKFVKGEIFFMDIASPFPTRAFRNAKPGSIPVDPTAFAHTLSARFQRP